MKTKVYIIFWMFLCVNLVCAQDYKYFDIAYSSEYRVQFSPKDLTYSDIGENGTGTEGYQVRYNQNYYEVFTPIFKEVFGYPYTGDVKIFSKIRCVFYLRKDFEPYYFFVSFPADQKDEFPELEEKIYHFGKKCMQANIRAFIEVWNEDKFQGTTFDVNLGSLYDFLDGKISLETLKLMH